MKIRRSQVWLRCVGAAVAVAVLAIGGVAQAAKGPTDFLKSVRTDLAKILKAPAPAAGSKEDAARDTKLRALVNRLFDFGELGTRSMGAHWAKLTPAQQEDFVATIGALIENSYMTG